MFNPKKIIILDQAENPLHHLKLETESIFTTTKIRKVIGDVRNREAMDAIFKTYRQQFEYHATAYKHVPLMKKNPCQAIFTNILGAKNLADLSCRCNVKKFVMVSTDKAVNPSSVMGAGKRIAKKYVQSLQLKDQLEKGSGATKFITTRFGNVLGSNGSVVPLFTKQIAEGWPLTITHKDIIRYFMTTPEACQLVLEAGAMGNGGEIYIFEMGKPVKIIDLARKMIRLAEFIPEKNLKIQIVRLRLGEKLYEELLSDTSKSIRTHLAKIMIAQEIQQEFENLYTDVDQLIKIANLFASESMVAQMKKIVPEFKSMISAYEVLDRQEECVEVPFFKPISCKCLLLIQQESERNF